MDRVLQFGLFLLCLTGFSFGQKATCSYFGEPHLVPFPTECEPVQNQWICQTPNPELLASNQYLQVNVVASVIGNYPIVKYNLTIFPVTGYPDACVISDDVSHRQSWPPVCSANSPVVVVAVGPNYYLIHKTQDIQINVNFVKRYFEIEITQPFDLIPDTEGVCVDWDCQFELYLTGGSRRKRSDDDDLCTQICNDHVTAAEGVAQNYGDIDATRIQGRLAGCIYDLQQTADPCFAEGALVALSQASFASYLGDPKYPSIYTQAAAAINTAICQQTINYNNLIANNPQYCVTDASGQPNCLTVQALPAGC